MNLEFNKKQIIVKISKLCKDLFTNLCYRCNLEGSVVQASMSLQSGYPNYLVLIIMVIIMFLYVYIHEPCYHTFYVINIIICYIYIKGTSKAEVAVTLVYKDEDPEK